MSLPQFFVEDLQPGSVVLTEGDARHALRSLRLRPGDRVTLADGRGTVASGRVGRETDGRTVIDVLETWRVARTPPPVSVALAPPKGDRLWWAVQKLGELGVDEVIPIRTERSVRDWNDEGAADRMLSRLRAVAREAAMQSRRPFVTEVREPVALMDAVETATASVVALWEGSSTPLSTALPEERTAVRIVVGPEGGFSDGEIDSVRRAGAALASLGEGILRTETAAVVGAALVLARSGRLG